MEISSGTGVFFHAYHWIDEPHENRTLERVRGFPAPRWGAHPFSGNNPRFRSQCSLNLGLNLLSRLRRAKSGQYSWVHRLDSTSAYRYKVNHMLIAGKPRPTSLHNKILLGLLLGAAAGILANVLKARNPTLEKFLPPLLTYVMEPLGQIFLRLLFMVVIPLVFSSLTLGVAGLGDLKKLGRMGLKTFAFFLMSMALAVVLGLALVNTIRPGEGLPGSTRESLLETYRGQAVSTASTAAAGPAFGIQTFVNFIPRNPIDAAVRGDMVAVIFFSLMLGIALTMIPAENGHVWRHFLEGLGHAMVVIIGMAMKLAPFGVFALIFTVTARFGFDILRQLSMFVATVLAGLMFHQFITLSAMIRIFAGIKPLTFFRKIKSVMITAFSTSSSNATLPTTIKVSEEELGVPAQIAGFVLPLGATMNMNGTALFEGVTAVFLAQVFGIHLTLLQQLVIIVLSVVSAVGAAGVPGGSIPLLVLVISAVGVPPEGIAIIIGVDRLLDMCRTTLNVTGDVACAAFIARSEGFRLKPEV
jgi:DAACS family dicarboxylate/amino acid:cation (Na+ or H+) symporter